jgi:hypothetical protein
MDKQRILDEIRRTAQANSGTPLGVARFETETGISESAWRGRFWARWSDAVKEAGLTPNVRQPKTDTDVVLGHLAMFIRELGRYPTQSELRLRKRERAAFPNRQVFERLGSRAELAALLSSFCERSGGWSDVAAICQTIAASSPPSTAPESGDTEFETGYVYLALMKVGREKRYKIGKADVVERRARQIAVHLPEELELVHAISTDDAYGIEAYWHKRFAEKRRGGEWFELTAADVKAFRRRRFM